VRRIWQAAWAACFLGSLLFAGVAVAQAAAESEAEFEVAPVTLDGRALFHVRGVSALPARERAAGISDRIREAAADRDFDPAEIQVIETVEVDLLSAGPVTFMRVFNGDAELEQIDRRALSMVHAHAIRNAITEYREQRRPEYLRRGLVTALIATTVLTVFLWLLIWLARRLANLMERRIRAKVVGLRVQSIQLVPGEQIWAAITMLARGLRLIAILLALFVYAQIVLRQFPQTSAIGERLTAYLIDPLKTMGRGFVEELPSLMFLLVLFFVVRFVLRILRIYFGAIGSGAVKVANFQPEWSVPTYRLVRLGVVAFALVVAYPYVPGSGSEAFKGLSIFFGVLLSIGSSSFISNNVSGYALIYRRLFAVGDRVRIDDMVGEVLDIRLQVTRLRTVKNEEIIVPNSTIMNSVVMNYSTLAATQGLILHTTVGIGYETPWRQVEGMLLLAAARTPGIEQTPPAFVLQKALGDFCVTYELNAYTSSAASMAEKYHALHANILDVFNEYGVQIMTPAYEGDPPEPKVVPKDRWYQEPSLPAAGGATPTKR
jgi:small-conductance mechanosensitive channel